jgi:site-specific DNA-methyltransferase (adenine-specific)
VFVEYESGIFAKGDCLEVMKTMPDNYFDMILCDLPYGTTACKWDSVIDLDLLWGQYKRMIKDNGVIVLTASQPFTTRLISSNYEMFRYCWVWEKNKPQGFLNAKKMPLKNVEDIVIFSNNITVYNAQDLIKIDKVIKNAGTKNSSSSKSNGDKTAANNAIKNKYYKQEYTNYPTQVLRFKNSGNKQLHPTQKPVELFEYLIKTYTNEGQRILDNCAGSGTTAIAAINTNRKWVCIEKDDVYFEKANERIKQHLESLCQPQKPD